MADQQQPQVPAPAPASDEPVPRLPRGKGIKLSGPEMFRILLTAGMLVALLVLAKPCGDAVSGFVMRFDNGSASKEMPKPGKVDPPPPARPEPRGVLIRADMTDEEKRAAIEQARQEAKAAGSGSGAGSGSAAAAAAGSGR